MIDNTDLIIQLREAGLIDEPRLRRGMQLAEQNELSLYHALIEYSLVDEHDVVRIASRLLNVPSINLSTQEIDPAVADRVAASLAYRNRALPLRIVQETDGALLLLAMVDPFDMLAMDEIAGHTGVDIRPVLVGPADLTAALQRVYKDRDKEGFADHGLDHSSVPSFTSSLPENNASKSWARLFDTAQASGIDEESSVISQEMRDRPPTDVFESMYFEDIPSDAFSLSQGFGDFPSTGPTVKISLDEWELDSAFSHQAGHAGSREGLLSSDSIVEDEESQKSTSNFSKSDAPISQLARIQVKRIAVPIADAQKKVHREDHEVSVLDSFGSDELLRATIRLLMKNGVFTLEELLAGLKSD